MMHGTSVRSIQLYPPLLQTANQIPGYILWASSMLPIGLAIALLGVFSEDFRLVAGAVEID